jgi:membrane associated rhomboid family serine protease
MLEEKSRQQPKNPSIATLTGGHLVYREYWQIVNSPRSHENCDIYFLFRCRNPNIVDQRVNFGSLNVSTRERHSMTRHAVRDELSGVLTFVCLVWAVFFIGLVLPLRLDTFGITPRTLRGLTGIPAAPFLHANLAHLISNTVPLTLLLLLLAGSRAESWIIVAGIVLFGGALLWMFGRPAIHIGASGLIYGLIAYLLVSGITERRILPMLIAILVGFLYGGTLASGVLPTLESHISWEGHLFGAIAGGAIALLLTKDRDTEKVPSLPTL